MAEFIAKKVSKVKVVDPDASYIVEGADAAPWRLLLAKRNLGTDDV